MNLMIPNIEQRKLEIEDFSNTKTLKCVLQIDRVENKYDDPNDISTLYFN